MAYVDAGLHDFFSTVDAGTGLYGSLPLGVAVTLELVGPGGGTWTIDRRGGSATRVLRRAVRRPDCRLRCSVDDFVALVNGELDVRRAFLEGRFEAEGDVGLVWRLQKLLVARKGA